MDKIVVAIMDENQNIIKGTGVDFTESKNKSASLKKLMYVVEDIIRKTIEVE